MTGQPSLALLAETLCPVSLIPVTSSDFDLVHAWMSDAKTARWLDMGGGRQTLTPLQMRAFLANPRLRMFLFGEPGEQPVGIMALNDIGHLMRVTEVWGLRARAGGPSDLALSAFLKVIATAFIDFESEVVWTGVLENNHRSIRVHDRIGMPRSGLLRARHVFGGRRVNRIIFEFLREEFEKSFGFVEAVSGRTLSGSHA